MVVCIAGMHRSATSMITRMLSICGVYLGEAQELYPAQPDNPEGFWEHFEFHALNERILAAFHGAWDAPPSLPDDWLRDPKLDPIREEARILIDKFKGRENWGWKDPRNSLTLPFWQELIPGLITIVPVRHPLDVAKSLVARGHSSQPFGLSLWLAYSASLDAQYDADNMLFTHQTVYFQDATPELDRLIQFCKLTPSEAQKKEALSTISSKLRHSNSSIVDLFQASVAPQIVRQYLVDCLRCGENFEPTLLKQLSEVSNTEPALQGQLETTKRDLNQERMRSAHKDKEILELQEAIRTADERKDAELGTAHASYEENLQATHASYKQHITDIEEKFQTTLKDVRSGYDAVVFDAHEAVSQLQQKVKNMEESASWRIGNKIVRLLSLGKKRPLP